MPKLLRANCRSNFNRPTTLHNYCFSALWHFRSAAPWPKYFHFCLLAVWLFVRSVAGKRQSHIDFDKVNVKLNLGEDRHVIDILLML